MANIKDTSNDLVDIQGQLEKVLSKYEKLNNFNFNQMWDGLKNSIKESTTETEKLNFQYKSVNSEINDSLKLMEKVSKSKKGGVIESEKMIKLGNQLQNQLDERLHIEEQLKQIATSESLRQKSSLTWVSNKFKEIKQMVTDHPMIIADMAALYVFKQIYNVFDQLDSAAADFRKSMGITRTDSSKLESDVRTISISLMSIGVSAKDVYGSIKAIADEFGSTATYSSDMVSDMATLTAQFGITGQTSAKFVKSMAMVSNSTSSTQKDMLMIAQRMSAAAGVPLDAVMNDVAEASHDSYQFLSRNPLELLKAAVKARELGTTLSSSAKSSASLLNFTESVKAEMEASVLLGKSMNLQKARELAYHRDIAGLNVEIVKLAKDANFEQLDPFQQDAVAKALGKSAGEVASMLESDREHANIMKAMSETDKVRYNEMMKMNKSQIKDYAEMARKEVQTMSNQKAIAAISAAWSSIFAKLGESVFPIIKVVLEAIAADLSHGKLSLIGWALAGAAVVGSVVMIWKTFNLVKNSLFGIKSLTDGISKSIKPTKSGGFGGFIKSIAEGLTSFSKVPWSGMLKAGLILPILSIGIASLGASLLIFSKVKWGDIGKGLVALVAFGALGAIFGVLSEVLIPGAIAIGLLGLALIPFAGAAWIASKALQNLVDVPFLKIVGGLSLLGLAAPLVIAAGLGLGLAAPGITMFSLALRLLAGPAEKVGQSMLNLGNGIKMSVDSLIALKNLSFIDTISQIKIMSSAINELNKSAGGMSKIKLPEINIGKMMPSSQKVVVPSEKPEISMLREKSTDFSYDVNKVNNTQTSDTLLQKKLDDLLTSNNSLNENITGLRNDMKNGSINANVFLDSQKLDSQMGRRLKYTGALA